MPACLHETSAEALPSKAWVEYCDTDPDSDIEVLENVPVGALSVILMDAETGLAVWAGVATADIQQDPTVESTKKRLDFAVSEMFSKLPH